MFHYLVGGGGFFEVGVFEDLVGVYVGRLRNVLLNVFYLVDRPQLVLRKHVDYRFAVVGILWGFLFDELAVLRITELTLGLGGGVENEVGVFGPTVLTADVAGLLAP